MTVYQLWNGNLKGNKQEVGLKQPGGEQRRRKKPAGKVRGEAGT